MKGLAMLGLNKVGWIEKENPTPGPLDAIVRPVAISPCTSDCHTVWEGAIGERHDLILGHEGVAEVVETGELVHDFTPGDLVILPAITPDWNTVPSQMGLSQHCSGMLSGWKFSNTKDGTFGEYIHVNDADGNLAKLPDGISPAEGAMLSDMVPTGFHGAFLADVQYGETVAVIGIGPVGLMAVAAASLRGAGRIIAVGSRPVCANVAQYYGATDVINYKQGDIVEQIQGLTHAQGVDKVIIAGGTNDVFAQAIHIIRPGGIVANINYLSGSDTIPIPREAWGVGMSHIQIIGGLMPGGRKNITYLSRLLKYKRLDVAPLLTHRFNGFDHIEHCLYLMKDKPQDLIKPVVVL